MVHVDESVASFEQAKGGDCVGGPDTLAKYKLAFSLLDSYSEFLRFLRLFYKKKLSTIRLLREPWWQLTRSPRKPLRYALNGINRPRLHRSVHSLLSFLPRRPIAFPSLPFYNR